MAEEIRCKTPILFPHLLRQRFTIDNALFGVYVWNRTCLALNLRGMTLTSPKKHATSDVTCCSWSSLCQVWSSFFSAPFTPSPSFLAFLILLFIGIKGIVLMNKILFFLTPEYAEVEHLFLVILAPGGPRLSATPLTPSACSRPSRPFPWQSVPNWKRYHFSNT